jgi:glutathionylspermidine synthase
VGPRPATASAPTGFVFQELHDLGDRFAGRTPVIGSWLVQGEPAGVGIRESASPITTNQSQFLPHLVREPA